MKSLPLAAVLLLVSFSAGAESPEFNLKLPVRAESPEFNLKEPISLDLKDAQLTEVITLLGQLANVPVSISPDVQGTVTIQVIDMPYERLLQILGQQNNLSLRIEGGKLVATSARKGPSGAPSVPAPTIDRPVSDPRMPVEEYSKASSRPWPLFFRMLASGEARCFRLDFESGTSFEIPISGLDTPALVSQLGREPVSHTRFLIVEFPGMPSRALALREPVGVIAESKALSWAVLSAPHAQEACSDPMPRRLAGAAVVRTLRLEARESRANGELLAAPQINVSGGSVFSVTGGLPDPSGQHREIRISGYLSADGRSVAVALVATAIWTDPSDGREYIYAQTSSSQDIPFVQLAQDAVVAATLPAGAALENPVELTVRLAPAAPK